MERKKTPLWASHRQLGAKLIDFGGWDMPVSYPAGTIKEHKAVREAVGLFDVSHMGEAYLRGPKAREVVGRLTTNAVESAPVGKAVYTLLCQPLGLGGRAPLRLENKVPLYGSDIDDDHTPLEAGLGWAVKLDKGDFLGRAALLEQKHNGVTQQLVGFTIDESQRAIARHGYSI